MHLTTLKLLRPPTSVQTPAIKRSLLILLAALALVTWLAPADRVLGNLVKLVYLHGAIIQVALLALLTAGFLGLSFLIWPRPVLLVWSQATERTAFILWILYVVTSAASMARAWGGIAWFEPRWVFGLQMLVIIPVLQLAGLLLQDKRLAAGLNLATALIMLFLRWRASLVLHPLDPIGASSSLAIKVAYALLLLLVFLTAVQLTRWLAQAPATSPDQAA
jgi:hypothetical protein